MSATGLLPNLTPGQMGTGITSLGGAIANIGNAASGTIPQSTLARPATVATPQATPTIPNQAAAVNAAINPTATNAPVAQTQTPSSDLFPQVAAPTAPVTSNVPTATAVPNGSAAPVNSGQNTDIYGATGGVINQLESEETPGNADSLAQSIINANQPNVAQGSAQLNTGLAAAGISPSSSVSAIENANYQGQVQQQNTSELAQVNLEEQQMQQQLAETLLPSAQTQNTDSSGWSIFGDVMSGLGDVATLGAKAAV